MSRAVRLAGKRTRGKTLATRLVMCHLASYASADLRAWPTQKELASVCQMTDRGVRKALRELVELGEIRVLSHGQGRGATVYYLAVLDPAFDVIEQSPNRNGGSYLDDGPNRNGGSYLSDEQTGTTIPVSKGGKPEPRGIETGTAVPIEEIEDNIGAQPPRVSQAESAGFRAEKTQAESPPLSQQESDITNGAVAGRLGDHAREDTPRRAAIETGHQPETLHDPVAAEVAAMIGGEVD